MKARKDMIRMGTKVGGAFGVIAFLVFGLIPGFYFGSYGTLVLLNHLFGGPVEATVLVRVAIALGIIVGIACIASVSIVAGAVLGTMAGYASEAVTNLLKAKPTAAEDSLVKAKSK
ncbi:MAG: hypothetical protein AAB089_08660 [Nitrospirota bacterium]